ncbi:unnamed protein product [Somion occarium]|uniref:NadR/Ttd14 AAA domain-containing protein n=1 Tax=Somion occarium TaxID=3059160 RepID=A0ABP1DVI3_9APHY
MDSSSTAKNDALAAIFVLGPSSSGKTTLCDALVEDLCLDRSKYIKEVARKVMRSTGFTRNDTHTYDMQAAIMKAQIEAETRVLHDAKSTSEGLVLLSDRSAVDPIVYAFSAKVKIAKETGERLLEDHDFRTILPVYRRSLFAGTRMVV